ncbi:MAG TPA: twin-arginine translocase subunit TatC [Solirubrobacteraceae bacterium]|nr:twin-arginine translocase subunit TatC [Solirubrobacteraceae bacterium]
MQIPGALAPMGLRPVSHDAQLSVVGHLDELRSRLIVSLLALAVAFGLCFWQNHRILRLVNQPLAHNTQQQVRAGHGPLGATYHVQLSARDVAKQLGVVVGTLRAQPQSAATQSSLAQVQKSLGKDVKSLSAAPQGDRPVTLGIGEPFTATLTVTLIFALILALPVVLLQAYGFFMPAFEPQLRRRMLPVTLAIPALFAAGVAFGYAVVLPASLHFFQNFNSGEFNVLVQANQYYKFAATVLLAMGLLFQVPVAIIAVTRAGLVTPSQLRRNRRWAVLACCLVAAVLPGDAITMLLETLPLYGLFELSVMIAAVGERRARKRAAAEAHAAATRSDEIG